MSSDLYPILLLAIAFILAHNKAARILVVTPTPSISHQVVFHPLTQELATRGHEVVHLTTDPAFPEGKAPANLTEIDLHKLSYKVWEEFYKASRGGTGDLINQIRILVESATAVFEMQVLTEQVQKIIHNENETFDLLLLEAWVRPTLIFSHIYKVPVILVSSLGALFDNHATLGTPWNPILYPSPLRQRLNNPTLWEKMIEAYTYLRYEYMYLCHEEEENKMIRRIFGDNVPLLSELKKNVNMLFLNCNPLWEGNIPVPSTVIHAGYLHQKPQTELPKNLKEYLDSSINGVIYISFGTNVYPSSLPREKIQMMVNVLSQLPYDVLWKWDEDKMPWRSNNINISKWFPQSDLLRHPAIKLFITQGGLQSTDESITAGVPLIGMPMHADQWFNVEKYIQHKIGLKLDFDALTEDNFRNSIDMVIRDKSYRKNIIKLRTVMFDQQQSSLDRAVWWIEYVLRHGGASHCRAPEANMTWTQYLDLELILSLSLVLIFMSVSLVTIIYYFLKLSLRKWNFKIKKQ